MIDVELNQIRDKEKESSKAGVETAGGQRECANVSNRFYGGSGILRPFFVQTPGQGSESFLMEDLTDRSRTEANAAILEDFADFVNGVVFLSQVYDSVPAGGLAGSLGRPTARRGKEAGMGITAEMMTKDSESLRRVSELGSNHIGGLVVDEISPQSLILPLLRMRGFKEESSAFRYFFWCAYSHICTLLY